MRRFVHLLLLVAIVVAVRACGGAALAEDRLAVGTRWIAEKTGLAAVQGVWERAVRPEVSSATNSFSASLYQAASRTMDRAEAAMNGTAQSMVTGMNRAVNWAWSGVRSAIFPNQDQQPPPSPGAAPAPTDSPANE